ncbi:hypothetical protein ABW19_dt0209781 [Dactylella cylindrospora]|nr:hypothetical protein ABW19_dt0209781 [Dactylella cylindrospora]
MVDFGQLFRYYKYLVLQKINNAFEPGDPVLELATAGRGSTSVVPGGTEKEWIVRPEQEKIDRVVAGEEHGHYYLLLGEKGCGKTSMILDAMHKVDGLGIAMMECHAGQFFRIPTTCKRGENLQWQCAEKTWKYSAYGSGKL